jgi:hypothetical protein
MVLGRNPRRAKTKGASGNPSTPERGIAMRERANREFNEKLEKMRKKRQEMAKPKPETAVEINPMATPAEVQNVKP